ncbi:MAG TPA: DUF2071 domain-containing protein [Acidimicrobiia bacterium]|nr:DUF2071 domain-containing protein [Acidimicrobiia bacterium]
MTLMIQRWESVSFVHWSYEPGQVQGLVPRELVLDTFGGRAWVSLVAFFVKARLPLMPSLPPLTHFAQINLRIYVLGPQGDPGIWFLSLDADSLGAAVGGRLLYRVPFHWSRTEMRRSAGYISYSTQRRDHTRLDSKVEIELLEPNRNEDPDSISTFLLERYLMFGGSSSRLVTARAKHPPWSLQRARVRSLDDRLLRAGGLEGPGTEELVHWSPGVEAQISRPRELAVAN